MPQLEVTLKTKRAVRVWAGLPPTGRVLLDDELEDLRPGAMNELLVRINEEFEGDTGFPISQSDWAKLTLETVRSVRDEAQRRREA